MKICKTLKEHWGHNGMIEKGSIVFLINGKKNDFRVMDPKSGSIGWPELERNFNESYEEISDLDDFNTAMQLCDDFYREIYMTVRKAKALVDKKITYKEKNQEVLDALRTLKNYMKT